MEGTLEAIMEICDTYNCEQQCKFQFVDFSVGPPTEKDVELAKETNGRKGLFVLKFLFIAIIYTFNVSPPSSVKTAADQSSVRIESYNVIYRLISAIRQELSSRLPVKTELELVGEGHVLKVEEIHLH